jgi:signal transduction histidine kinase
MDFRQGIGGEAGVQQDSVLADILIIDDAADNLALLEQLLTDAGYEVRIACDGAAGLRAAHAQAPDLILLDVRLPYMDGFAVCVEFKAAEALNSIPVIFISAAHDVGDKVRAFEVGGVDYITKPFHAKEVLARVKTHLELTHLREQEKALILLKERQRLARDLHDSVKQTLFMIAASVESLQLHFDLPDDKLAVGLNQLRELSRAAQAEMNLMLYELHPGKLVEVELDKLLRQLAESLNERTSAAITVVAESLITPLPAAVKIAFYRVAQEALTNAIRHAHAAHITVTLFTRDEQVQLLVEDDGDGFDLEEISTGGFGLGNMRERANALDMELWINSQPENGTQIMLSWRQR